MAASRPHMCVPGTSIGKRSAEREMEMLRMLADSADPKLWRMWLLKQRFLDRLRHTLQDLNHDEFVTLHDLEQRAADW